MTLPTLTHAIFSTLQGSQNLATKPTLQRAKNANAQVPYLGRRFIKSLIHQMRNKSLFL